VHLFGSKIRTYNNVTLYGIKSKSPVMLSVMPGYDPIDDVY
jgi:hypothetical protein